VKDILPAAEMYSTFLETNYDTALGGEVFRWKLKWQNVPVERRPKNIRETLAQFSPHVKEAYPNIYKLFVIFGVLPVTTATTERSFSLLNRIFTDYRWEYVKACKTKISIQSNYGR
jgi:hypothetical protein